jgi:hypothetical protein
MPSVVIALSAVQSAPEQSLSPKNTTLFFDVAREIAKEEVPKVLIFENEKIGNVHLA